MSHFCSKSSTPHPWFPLHLNWAFISIYNLKIKKVLAMAHKIDCDPYKEQHSPTPLLDQSYLIFYHSPLSLWAIVTFVSWSSLCLEYLPPQPISWLSHFIQVSTQFLQRLSLITLSKSVSPNHTHSNILLYLSWYYLVLTYPSTTRSSMRTRTVICSTMYPHYLEGRRKIGAQ